MFDTLLRPSVAISPLPKYLFQHGVRTLRSNGGAGRA
jgi:hypothetical protein